MRRTLFHPPCRYPWRALTLAAQEIGGTFDSIRPETGTQGLRHLPRPAANAGGVEAHAESPPSDTTSLRGLIERRSRDGPVTKEYRSRVPLAHAAAAQHRNNCTDPTPGIPTREGRDSRQGLASESPGWALTAQRSEPERLPWLQAMNGVVWERLVRIPPRRAMGMAHGWGPRATRAAYIRCFGRPPHCDRGRYVYSPAELLAVADLLEAEAAAWEVAR